MNNGHLSASQRRIRELEQQVAVLQQMQLEYNVFLNYIVAYCGQDYTAIVEEGSVGNVFVINTEKLKQLKICGIRTEIAKDGLTMTISRLPDAPPSEPKSRIIMP